MKTLRTKRKERKEKEFEWLEQQFEPYVQAWQRLKAPDDYPKLTEEDIIRIIRDHDAREAAAAAERQRHRSAAMHTAFRAADRLFHPVQFSFKWQLAYSMLAAIFVFRLI